MENDDKEFLRRKALFEPMLASEAWKELEQILKAQAETQIAILTRAPNPDQNGLAQVMGSEYRKGAVFGIQLTLTTPHAIIKTANEIIEARQEPKENSNAPGNYSTSSRRGDDLNPELNLPEHARITDLGGPESE